MQRATRVAAAIMAVATLATAYSCRAPWYCAPLSIAGFAASLSGKTAKSAALWAFLLSAAASAITLHWLPDGLARSSGCPLAIALLLTAAGAAIYSARFALAAWADARSVSNGWPRGVGFITGFCVAEFALPGPMPWYLGVTLHDAPALLQVARVAGPVGVSAVVIAGGLLLHTLGRLAYLRVNSHAAHELHATALRALGWSVLVLGAAGYGYWQVGHAAASTELQSRIGIVQANVPPESTRDEQAGIAAIRKQVLATWNLRERGADLVVWGESAVPVAVPAARVRELYPNLFTAALGVPALLGAALTADTTQKFYNTAISVDAHGEVRGTYVKRHLAPFSEDLPGRDSVRFLQALFPEAREVPGPEHPETLRPLDHPISVAICFESLSPALLRNSVKDDHAHAIVALVNDGWFGDTWEPWMHFASAKLRAVENGRYLVRASGTGISGIIDPFGRVQAQTRPMSQASIVAPIGWRSETTPYQRFGDSWLLVPALAIAFMMLKKRQHTVRRTSTPQRSLRECV